MQRNRMTWMAAMLGMAAFTSLAGCSKGTPAGDKGAATLNVSSKLAVTDAKSVKVVVQGAAESVNITLPLVANATSTQWSAIVSDLPIGSDYVFTASAYAADGTTLLYQGAVTGQAITKNQTANIVIDMNQVATPVSLYDEAPVIAGLTETASCVSKGDTVTIKATASDPDAGDTVGMGWSWSVDATCGTLSAPVNVPGTDTAHPGTSTVIFTATATSANCQVNLTIADARQPAVLMTTGSVTISIGNACAFGNAKITAIPNTCPVVANIGASVVPVQNTPSYVPMVVGQSTWVSVSATDADNDTLLYTWSSPDCAGGTPTTTFGNFNAPTNTAGTWFLLTSAPTSGTCTFLVHVSDGTFADGKPKCDIVNHLSMPVKGAGDVVKANPVFGYDYQSAGTVNDGDVVKLEVVAPSTGCPSPYALVWSPAGTPLTTLDPPFTTGITFTAPAGAGANGASVTVTATCPDTSLSTSHLFSLVGTNAVCNGAADGTDCTTTAQLSDKCVTVAKCATGQCVAQTSVTCPASTVACQTNVCGHLTDGLCHLTAASDGTTCSDGLACTTGDKCGAGVCGGTAVTCASTGNSCTQNTCQEPNGTCAVSNLPNTTTCNDGLLCTSGDICTNGVCGGTQLSCQSGFACYESGAGAGTCTAQQCAYPAPNSVATFFPTLNGIAGGATTLWDTGKYYSNLVGGVDVGFNFGANTIKVDSGADMFLNKLDPATGKALASFKMGNTGGGDQIGAAVAVDKSGNPIVIGSYTGGQIKFNTGAAGIGKLADVVSVPGTAMNFYMVVNGTTSTPAVAPVAATIKGQSVDVGSGALLAAASNPNVDAFAICGKTSIADLAVGNAGLTSAGGTAGGGMDILVAVINNDGSVKWGLQFGGTGDQICTAIAMDNSGNVYITGTNAGALDFGGGHALTTVTASGVALPYVAVLAAADGTVTQAAQWGTTGNNAVNAIATDGTNVYIGGALAASTTFGGVSLVDSGLTDAFILKMSTSLVPSCGLDLGDATSDQAVKGLGLSGTSLYVGGAFQGTLSPLTITSTAGTLDGFTLEVGTANCTIGCPKQLTEDPSAPAGTSAGTQTVGAVTMQGSNWWVAGIYSSSMSLGGVSLPLTGSAGTNFNYVAHLIP